MQYHHQTDVSDEEMMKLNFGYFVKDFTEDQVQIFHIRVSSMLMLISVHVNVYVYVVWQEKLRHVSTNRLLSYYFLSMRNSIFILFPSEIYIKLFN